MSNIDFNQLRDRAYKCACDHGFHQLELSNEHFLMLVITELSEAVEADRKGRHHYAKKFSNPKVEIEEWKPIKNYEKDYEVSNLGRVKSKDMLVWGGRGYYLKKGIILKPGLSGTGYYTVSLRGKTHKVACLVADAFLIKKSDNDYVNHIDGNKTNDNVSNLEYISPSSNSKHASITGLHIYKGKLSYEQKIEIAFLHKHGLAYTTIYKNKDYGVSKSAIQRICNEYEKYTDSVEFELADAVIRLLDLAGLRGVDIAPSYENIVESMRKFYDGKTFTESIYLISTFPVTYENIYNFDDILNIMIIYILGLAKHIGIDLPFFIEQKMKYNQLREQKHGKEY